MIPISELLSREAKEAETKSIVVELKLNDDDDVDDDFSSSRSIAVDITLLGMLMSGIVSEDDDDGMDIGSTQSDDEINDGDEGSESDSGDDLGTKLLYFTRVRLYFTLLTPNYFSLLYF